MYAAYYFIDGCKHYEPWSDCSLRNSLIWVIFFTIKATKVHQQMKKQINIVMSDGIGFWQGCGNTMPDFSDQVPFHSGQVENFYLLVLGQVECIKLIQFCISYFDSLLRAHILHWKQWESWSAGFFRSQLIWIYTVFKRSQLIRIHTVYKSWYISGFKLFVKV